MDGFKLNTNVTIPSIGFGTWEINRSETAQAVQMALQAGYRLFDTAKIYGNESEVGKAVASSGLKREELFITTKLWNSDQGYDATHEAFDESLAKLGLDYLDLYLIHWPATKRRSDSWRAMSELQATGRVRSIGVSNYTIDHLKELLEESDVVPAVNQVEFHPFIYEQQQPLLEFCTKHGILIEAYSPLSRLNSTASQLIDTIATRVRKSKQQVILRWCLQHGTVPLPRSTNADHIRSNLEIFDFELSDEDMRALNTVSDGERVTWDPAHMS